MVLFLFSTRTLHSLPYFFNISHPFSVSFTISKLGTPTIFTFFTAPYLFTSLSPPIITSSPPPSSFSTILFFSTTRTCFKAYFAAAASATSTSESSSSGLWLGLSVYLIESVVLLLGWKCYLDSKSLEAEWFKDDDSDANFSKELGAFLFRGCVCMGTR